MGIFPKKKLKYFASKDDLQTLAYSVKEIFNSLPTIASRVIGYHMYSNIAHMNNFVSLYVVKIARASSLAKLPYLYQHCFTP